MLKFIILPLSIVALFGCTEATTVSHNMSKAADNFHVERRVIFYNGITNTYILTIQGKCNITDQSKQLEVLCKVGAGEYKKHFLGLSDNVTYFVEQLYSKSVNPYNYEVVFNPQAIIPDVNFRGSQKYLQKALTPDQQD